MAFIDIEVGVDSGKVQDYGAIRGDGAMLHSRSAVCLANIVMTKGVIVYL